MAVLFARPFPPEQETDPANPALAGQQKPYRWGTYLGTLLFTSALVMCIDVLIYILESKALWAVISFAGAVLSLAGSMDLFRRNWRSVFLFNADDSSTSGRRAMAHIRRPDRSHPVVQPDLFSKAEAAHAARRLNRLRDACELAKHIRQNPTITEILGFLRGIDTRQSLERGLGAVVSDGPYRHA